MKKLTKKRIIIRFMDFDGIWIINLILTLMSLIIVVILIVVFDIDGNIYPGQQRPGYYCKYCHHGAGYTDKYKKTTGRLLCKQYAIVELRKIPCPCSKDGMHKLKWYEDDPAEVNKKAYIK